MTAFLGVLIWIGIIIVLFLAIRSVINKVIEKKKSKNKNDSDIENVDRKEN